MTGYSVIALDQLAGLFITIGTLLALGFLVDTLGERTRLPRVTLLLILGIAIGPLAFNVLPEQASHWFPFISHVALVMIGFLLGEKLTFDKLKTNGRFVLVISLSVMLVTFAVVALGLLLSGSALATAILLAAIATATDPAACLDVVNQLRAKGKFTDTLLGIVAVDDAWGIILFSIVFATAQFIVLGTEDVPASLLRGMWELAMACLIGGVLGLLLAYSSGRYTTGQPNILEALIFVFICAGVSLYAHVSYLLAAVVMGVVVANVAKHHEYPFHAISNIERPFMVIFFILAGASLNLNALSAIGVVGVMYIFLRVMGRIAGVRFAFLFMQAPTPHFKQMGLGLMPQAGVAIGLALAVEQTLPAISHQILPIVITSTIVFELFGPWLLKYTLVKAGEVKKD